MAPGQAIPMVRLELWMRRTLLAWRELPARARVLLHMVPASLFGSGMTRVLPSTDLRRGLVDSKAWKGPLPMAVYMSASYCDSSPRRAQRWLFQRVARICRFDGPAREDDQD